MAESTNECLKDLRKMFEGSHLTMDEDPSVWLKLVRDKLYSMFRSPLKEEYNREAFKWVASLCMSIGDFTWMCSDDVWTKEEAKMFSCIVRLSMNELHILLPIIQRHLTYGDKPELEDGKVMARSANSTEYDAFGDHLVILESAIKSLVKGQDDEGDGKNPLADCIDNQELKSLLERLKEIISEICDYLEVVHRYWLQLTDQMNTEKFSSAEGALRIMSVWLSEEPLGFETQCERFLIDLIIKNLLLLDRPTQDDLLILALHSVCTQNNKLLQNLKNNPKHKEALQKYLDYVQQEKIKSNNTSCNNDKRIEKVFKLRCGLVKDLLT